MEDSENAKEESITLTMYEYIPLGVLVLESVCAVLCNGAVLLLFCIRTSLLKTASDLFTINLSLVDLIFSGIVLPVVVVTAMTAINNSEENNNATRDMEVARNCVVLFGSIATALGTLLVSLDRGDVSLKPSKRFFTKSRAILAISVTWCIAIIGLAVAILPSLIALDKYDQNMTYNPEKSSHVSSMARNKTRIEYINYSAWSSDSCCNPHPCNVYTVNGCTVQLFFEIPIFIAAILTIVIIYGKILWSVQRRSKKYMHGTPRHANPNKSSESGMCVAPQCNFCGIDSCCGRSRTCSDTFSEKSVTQVENKHDDRSPKIEGKRASIRRRSLTVIRNLTGHKDTKKQDSLEDALFVNSSGKMDADDSPPKQVGNGEKKSKTDFATVAMSVTVVLAIKRMASRKIKERKKKIKHLRKMTFFIIFTFLFCWMPYYMSKLSIVLSLHVRKSAAFNFTKISNSSSQNDFAAAKRCTPGWIFTWMIAIAALSCIFNPILYMFSREKIRLEFMRMFFPSCSERKNGDQKRRSLSRCLLCWDTEDNFKDRSPNLHRSVVNSRWNDHARTTSSRARIELQTLPDQNRSCGEDRKTGLNSQDHLKVPKVEIRARAPLVRCDAVECDSLVGSHNSLDDCAECDLPLPNNGLLLPPTGIRIRSDSAKSVDVLSCSTTIASLDM